MTEEISAYELYRMQLGKGGFDQDNNSAHFSLKDSNLNFTDRMEVNSSRSTPYEARQSLQKQLATQKKMYSDLLSKHDELTEKYRNMEAKYQQTKNMLQDSQRQSNRLRQTLLKKKQVELATKKKLKEWVVQAKKGLDQ